MKMESRFADIVEKGDMRVVSQCGGAGESAGVNDREHARTRCFEIVGTQIPGVGWRSRIL